jgi:hypothetical protein
LPLWALCSLTLKKAEWFSSSSFIVWWQGLPPPQGSGALWVAVQLAQHSEVSSIFLTFYNWRYSSQIVSESLFIHMTKFKYQHFACSFSLFIILLLQFYSRFDLKYHFVFERQRRVARQLFEHIFYLQLPAM